MQRLRFILWPSILLLLSACAATPEPEKEADPAPEPEPLRNVDFKAPDSMKDGAKTPVIIMLDPPLEAGERLVVSFDDVEVARAEVVGGLQVSGFSLRFRAMKTGRLKVLRVEDGVVTGGAMKSIQVASATRIPRTNRLRTSYKDRMQDGEYQLLIANSSATQGFVKQLDLDFGTGHFVIHGSPYLSEYPFFTVTPIGVSEKPQLKIALSNQSGAPAPVNPYRGIPKFVLDEFATYLGQSVRPVAQYFFHARELDINNDGRKDYFLSARNRCDDIISCTGPVYAYVNGTYCFVGWAHTMDFELQKKPLTDVACRDINNSDGFYYYSLVKARQAEPHKPRDLGAGSWLDAPLYGNDNEVAKLKGVRIFRAEGRTRVSISNQFNFECDIELDRFGQPATVTNCSSVDEPRWWVKDKAVRFSCFRTKTEYICRGRYALCSDTGTYCSDSVMTIARRRK